MNKQDTRKDNKHQPLSRLISIVPSVSWFLDNEAVRDMSLRWPGVGWYVLEEAGREDPSEIS